MIWIHNRSPLGMLGLCPPHVLHKPFSMLGLRPSHVLHKPFSILGLFPALMFHNICKSLARLFVLHVTCEDTTKKMTIRFCFMLRVCLWPGYGRSTCGPRNVSTPNMCKHDDLNQPFHNVLCI
jgi:hypothetical protein